MEKVAERYFDRKPPVQPLQKRNEIIEKNPGAVRVPMVEKVE
jgi:hypothetical protein